MLHTGDEYADFLGLLDHPERFDEFARRQEFDHALLPSAYPDRYLGLIQHLLTAADWRLVFTDGTEVLFARNPPGEATPAAVDLADAGVVLRLLAALNARYPVQSLSERALTLTTEAREADFEELAVQAHALHQQLQSAHNKLRLAVNAN